MSAKVCTPLVPRNFKGLTDVFPWTPLRRQTLGSDQSGGSEGLIWY